MEQIKKQIYIAGKVEDDNKDIVKIAADLEERGHKITYKWWQQDIKKPYLSEKNIDKSSASSSEMEEAIRKSDVFILVPTPDILGAAIEFGIAIGDDRQDREILIAAGENARQSIFYANPRVVCLDGLAKIRNCKWY
jgi:hypothetical protein